MSKIVKLEFKEQLYSFNLDGWFNATEAAGRFGKAPAEWLRLPSTLSYLAAFKRKYGEIPYLKTQRGAGGGTWLHPKLAVRFAQWLSDDFAVWCDEQIDAIIRNGIRAEGNVNLLSLYLRDAAAEWEVRFTPEYYHALARLTCTRYSGHSGGTPACYGQITDKWVYGCLLPPDVHAELKARRGDSVKMHQWLTSGGQGLLDKQIDLVTTFARSSADLRDFEARMMAVTQRGGQMGIIFPRAA
ncbi:MAG: KilA-N domain-containing protein [Delftia acidovorans]|jgi:hypothetical protein|nr:KilA-N domain-containing protein [Delftia acidovorans]